MAVSLSLNIEIPLAWDHGCSARPRCSPVPRERQARIIGYLPLSLSLVHAPLRYPHLHTCILLSTVLAVRLIATGNSCPEGGRQSLGGGLLVNRLHPSDA